MTIYSCMDVDIGLPEVQINKSLHDKTNKMTLVPSEDSVQPGHLPSLISLCCPHEETFDPKLPIDCTAKI